MELTSKNYHSFEANEAYWSASLIKDFMSCEARAIGTLRGEWQPPASNALRVGSYVDAYFEGPDALEEFAANNPQIFKKDGTLKAEFIQADEMIARAESSKVFMEYLDGEKQVIKTGTLFGEFPFKIKMDVYVPGKRIVDLKTVRDMEPIYRKGEGRLDPIEFWRWTTQGAIYQAVEGNRLPFYLAIITKEDPPDLHLFQIDQRVLDAEMEWLKTKLPRFDAIKKGIVEPKRCEDCAYCRWSHKITGPELYTGEDQE